MLSEQVAHDLSAQDVADRSENSFGNGSTRPSRHHPDSGRSAHLAARDRSAETASVLAAFARDEREAPVDRGAAAAGLRLIATPEARDGLVEAAEFARRVRCASRRPGRSAASVTRRHCERWTSIVPT